MQKKNFFFLRSKRINNDSELGYNKIIIKISFSKKKIFENKLAWGFLCTRKKFFDLKKIFSKEKVIKLKNFTKIMPPIGFKVNIAGDYKKRKVGEKGVRIIE